MNLSSASGSGEEVLLLAVGENRDADNGDFDLGRGDITVVGGERTLYAGSGVLIAKGGIERASDFVLDFGGGGALRTAVSAGRIGSSNPSVSSSVSPEGLTDALRAYIAALGLSATEFVAVIFNPVNQLSTVIGRLYLDLGLFVEELSLYGLEGGGIALFYSQCEELEGCAARVTLEQLEKLILELEAGAGQFEVRPAGLSEGERQRIELLQLRLRRASILRRELREFLGLDEPEETEGNGDDFDIEEFDLEEPEDAGVDVGPALERWESSRESPLEVKAAPGGVWPQVSRVRGGEAG